LFTLTSHAHKNAAAPAQMSTVFMLVGSNDLGFGGRPSRRLTDDGFFGSSGRGPDWNIVVGRAGGEQECGGHRCESECSFHKWFLVGFPEAHTGTRLLGRAPGWPWLSYLTSVFTVLRTMTLEATRRSPSLT
jgi:hypothetical protein